MVVVEGRTSLQSFSPFVLRRVSPLPPHLFYWRFSRERRTPKRGHLHPHGTPLEVVVGKRSFWLLSPVSRKLFSDSSSSVPYPLKEDLRPLPIERRNIKKGGEKMLSVHSV